jgi:arylsulfatase A-like enzyme
MSPPINRRRVQGYSLLELVVVLGVIALLTGFVLSAVMAALRATDRLKVALGRKQPNVLVIVADDMGYADVGFHGCKDIPTPNIDSLASNGVVFKQGYVSGCLCSPTRAGLLTGRYQHRFGHDNLTPWAPFDASIGLDPMEVTLGDVLGKAGYATGHIGKWHLGAAVGMRPRQRGFQDHFGFLGAGHDYFRTTSSWAMETLSPILDNGRIVPMSEITYLTTDFTREAVEFIERYADRPFFLYLGYNAVHTPLQVPQKYLDRFAHIPGTTRRTYAAMLSAMDDGIGEVLAKLRDLSLEQDTLIFFFSDNGGPVTTGLPNGSSNEPLRGEKTTFWEGGIRVPFVVQWKGRLPKGTSYPHPVIALDIFPTAVAVAGAELPANRAYDGVNLLPYLTGESSKPPHPQLFWRQQRPGGQTQYGVRSGRYKLVKPTVTAGLQLYDLRNDPRETTNLYNQRPDLVTELTKLYDAWNALNVPPRW